ncbi:MAG TPA: hydrogenase maturation protease [Terriglobales bacterium]|nr:hydrogenase maturation protease [Terriglobales bacterium]
MPTLRQQLEQLLKQRVCFVGLGNVEYGDDGFGVGLAEALIDAGMPDVIVAGTAPDRWIGQLAAVDHVVFLDAIEFGGAPGDVVFLNSAQMAARFPQISTHKISLSLLAQWVEANGSTKAWLLGAQPGSLKSPQQLAPTLRETVDVLCELIGTSQIGLAAPGGSVNTLEALTEVTA